jgi:hypothetical protein
MSTFCNWKSVKHLSVADPSLVLFLKTRSTQLCTLGLESWNSEEQETQHQTCRELISACRQLEHLKLTDLTSVLDNGLLQYLGSTLTSMDLDANSLGLSVPLVCQLGRQCRQLRDFNIDLDVSGQTWVV